MITNISGYKFISLTKIATLRVDLRKYCQDINLLGTILLSREGININLAGERENIEKFKKFIANDARFTDIQFKESLSDLSPFSKMLIKLKKEIITMGVDNIQPPSIPEQIIEPKQLKQWLDSGKPIKLLDTRNGYEYKIGSFKNAIKLELANFRDFPAQIQQFSTEEKQQPIVMFCTGGVRCEKAMPFLQQQGFTNIYQLHGGILKYFEECGGDHWDGECFVFDDRIAVDSHLQATGTQLCTQCQMPVTQAEQMACQFMNKKLCPDCYNAAMAAS